LKKRRTCPRRKKKRANNGDFVLEAAGGREWRDAVRRLRRRVLRDLQEERDAASGGNEYLSIAANAVESSFSISRKYLLCILHHRHFRKTMDVSGRLFARANRGTSESETKFDCT
jgi:hypothetical protein